MVLKLGFFLLSIQSTKSGFPMGAHSIRTKWGQLSSFMLERVLRGSGLTLG